MRAIIIIIFLSLQTLALTKSPDDKISKGKKSAQESTGGKLKNKGECGKHECLDEKDGCQNEEAAKEADVKNCDGKCIPIAMKCNGKCGRHFCLKKDAICVRSMQKGGDWRTCDGKCVEVTKKCSGKCLASQCEGEDGTCQPMVEGDKLVKGTCKGKCTDKELPCNEKCELKKSVGFKGTLGTTYFQIHLRN